MSNAPPSLRVYTLAKQLPGLFSGTDLLAVDGQLLVELSRYAEEEARVAHDEIRRRDAEARRANHSSRLPSTRRRRR